jgi:outer membrane protein assembly factor BamB
MHVTNRLFVAALAVALAATAAHAQRVTTKVYSRPQVPSDEVLKRLNLNLAWKYYVPMDGRRDGLLRVEMNNRDMFVLTRSGTVAALDAETGKVAWRTTVGKPYSILPFIAVNNRAVYVIANVELFALDRSTGRKKWQYRLPAGVSAGPVVDEKQIYIPSSDTRVYAFTLPFVTLNDKGAPVSRVYGEQRQSEFEIRPRPVWSEQTNVNLSFRPLQTDETLFLISREGKVIITAKAQQNVTSSLELVRLSLEGKVTVPPGQYGEMAYAGSDDGATYAINMLTGKLKWRHVAGTAILRTPAAVDKDVFVTSEREGMTCLDRDTGEPRWKIPGGNRKILTTQREADEFLACNSRFVYVADRSGRLLILDRKRGVQLSWLDTTAFRVKIVNETTDRLYLAANDGLILCLHDRDQKEPIRHRKKFEDAGSPMNKILSEVVKAPEGKGEPLRAFLERMQKTYKVRYVILEKDFKDAELPVPLDKEVKTPASDDKTLREYIQKTLEQVDATFEVAAETVFVKPRPKKK